MTASIHSLEEHRAQLMAARGTVAFATITIDRDGDSVVILRDGTPVLELTVAGARGLWAVLGNELESGC